MGEGIGVVDACSRPGPLGACHPRSFVEVALVSAYGVSS